MTKFKIYVFRGLADMNGDGQMDINEFSVACKLITNQLKGFPLPKTLPPAMLVNPNAAPVAMPPVAAPVPAVMPVHSMAPGMMAQPQMMMPGAGMPGAAMPGAAMPGAGMPGAMPGMAPMGMPVASVPNMMPMQPMAGMPMTSAAPGMMGQVPVSGMAMMQQPGVPMQPPQPPVDWAVPMPTRQKYQVQFANTDRNRTGFLAGAQARNLLLQSGLPQNILAQIWGLSDVDNDGRLSTDEFILAGHFCELALKGEPLPPVGQLPPALVPPSMRGPKAPAAPGSTAGTAPGTPASGKAEEVGSPSTFEDKRRENFNKGQAELEKRRQSLIDQQKREEEERKRKEKEEAEAREKQK